MMEMLRHATTLDDAMGRILQNLYGGPNVVKLLDVVRDPQSKTPSLVSDLVPVPS